MANKQFIVKHGMDVKRTDGISSLSIASDTGALTMGQALNTTSTIESGAKLTVAAGGADINGMLDAKGGLNVTGGNLVVTNDLTVYGTTTTVNSTTVTIKDPVMEIGDNASDDDLDRGVQFHYHNGTTAKFGFMGFDDSSGKFAFIPDAGLDGGLQRYTGSAGTLVAALEGNADTATNFSSDRTLTISASDVNATSDSSATGAYTISLTIANNAVTLGKMAQLADLKVIGNVSGGAADPAAISIDTDIAGGVSANHDSLASANTIKAYVDAQLGSANALSELDEVTITSAAAGEMLMYHDGQWRDVAMSGDVTITSAGVTSIGANKVTDAMIQANGLSNSSLLYDSVSFGGIPCDLGASVAQPAFNLTNATNYPTSSLTGTITDAQLAGSITDGKLDKDYIQTSEVDGTSIAFGGGTLNVVADGIDATHIDWGDYSADNTKIDTDVIPEGDTNLFHTTARARASIAAPTVTNPDSMGNFAYNSTSGVFTFTGATATETRAHFSAVNNHNSMGGLGYAAGVYTYTGPTNAETVAQFDASAVDGFNLSNAGVITLDQSIKADATPTFAGLTITGNLVTNGTTTTVNATQMDVQDPVMRLASNNGADIRDIGLVGKYNDGADKHTALFRDASDGKWKLITGSTQADISTANEIVAANGSTGTLVATIEGNVTGALTGNADTATTLAATRTFAITGGGITAAAQNFNGSQNVSLSASIDANAVTLAKMAQLADMKVIGNVSGGAADPAAVGILDEDDMNSNSATALATQQSIKAYADLPATSRVHFSATAPVVYTSGTGVISLDADTDDIPESGSPTNLYFTDARVRLNRLDQMATPTADVAWGAKKITGLADGAAATDAVNKSQLDSVAAGTSTSVGGLSDVTVSGVADAHVMVYDDGDSEWQNQVMTGDITMTKDGVTSIGATKVTDAMIIGAGLANSSLATPNVTIATAANSALTGVGTVALGATLTLNVATDGSSLETDSDTLRVKALGITDAMLAGSISNAKLVDIANTKLVNSTISSKELGTNLDSLTDGNGIADFTFNGSSAASIALELESANALEVGASGLDLKDTIAGARTFSDEVTASSGVNTGSATQTSGSYTMTAAEEQVANTFAHATFRSAKYVAQVTNQAGSEYQCSELLVIHNGTTASVAEYGLMHTGAAALATFDVGINGANVELKATAGNGDVIKFSRSTLVI
jgi:hypothetical protein